MPPDEPAWWYRDTRSWQAQALAPAAAVYGAIAERRLRREAAFQAPMPVVCVGNFTVGGTGKTPTALLIADLLKALGHKPAFLTRGYGGTIQGPYVVDLTHDKADATGDEPLLLAGSAPTMISRDRAAGARAIAGAGQATVIIMDDGLQNPALKKSLKLALVDGVRGFGNGMVLPAGPLRAPLGAQLELVDAILVTGVGSQHSGSQGMPADSRVLDHLRSTFLGPVLEGITVPAIDPDFLREGRYLAYAGIGNPGRFFTMLDAAGCELAARRVFPDHHPFAEIEAMDLLDAAHAQGATLITTQKDLARLTGATGALAELRERSKTLPICMQLAPRDLERLQTLLKGAVG